MHKVIIYQSDDKINLSERFVLENPGMLQLAQAILGTIRKKLIHTVVVEGPPGVGKTTLMNHLVRTMDQMNMPYDLASTDDDVLPRAQRKGKEIIEFHPGEIVTESLRAKASGGGTFGYKGYNTKTGDIDLVLQKKVHAMNDAVLFVEGVRSIEYTMRWYMGLRGDIMSRVLFILLQKPAEVIERQRMERDTKLKGLTAQEVSRRIESQKSVLEDYYRDLANDLLKITNISTASGAETIKW